MSMQPLDYGRSFILGKWPENEVRFWVESRTRIIDELKGDEPTASPGTNGTGTYATTGGAR